MTFLAPTWIGYEKWKLSVLPNFHMKFPQTLPLNWNTEQFEILHSALNSFSVVSETVAKNWKFHVGILPKNHFWVISQLLARKHEKRIWRTLDDVWAKFVENSSYIGFEIVNHLIFLANFSSSQVTRKIFCISWNALQIIKLSHKENSEVIHCWNLKMFETFQLIFAVWSRKICRGLKSENSNLSDITFQHHVRKFSFLFLCNGHFIPIWLFLFAPTNWVSSFAPSESVSER